ncbi:hypothetical protein [Clostridium transplantifaecale]|uniref:hypothetical protein n=1 Tax=Clostridium transplantifaecale TaxID=2479838 RepID=UPI000F635FD6|nr:hypothetical protein [Clostridium transplantifaecale]
MKLFESIDWLLIGTKYLSWSIGLIGIIGSVILFFVNIPLGIGSAMVFAATFFLAISVTLLLLPSRFAKGRLEGNKRYITGAITFVIALVIMFAVWNVSGGFPNLNLIFA